jgi:3-methyladenine DNA glycosylase/8-oxoguanine DNA glycosylase
VSTVTEPAAGLAGRWVAPFPLNLGSTLGVHRRGRGDPAYLVDEAGAIWRTSLTPAGPGTLRLTARHAATHEQAGETVVAATAWGPGAGWLLDQLPVLLGTLDRPESFRPAHPVLRELAARHLGWRIGRSGRVLEALVPAVLEQKVVGVEARRAWRLLLTRFGAPAPGPGPAGLRVFPPPEVWASLPSWEWHRAGVEAVRARTIAAAAGVAGRLEEITTMPSAQADAALQSLPGIGPWTSAEARQRACGDADAVSVGDYHLPSLVGWALAGRRTDDAGMLELLAPYPGHRYRVTRLIEMSGLAPPRRGPRLAARDYREL